MIGDDRIIPMISVVTVVRNDLKGLEQTLISVLGQSYPHIEYIIIDGASTDGTIDIIRRYQDRITCWISEPDAGIYDAMNKGIDLATGEWIIFMNAGDTFYDHGTVEKVFLQDVGNADIAYGDHEVVYDDTCSAVRKAGRVDQLWKGMAFCHQSAFVRTELMRAYKFNTGNAIAADFEFLYKQYLSGQQFFNCGIIIASVRADGLSGDNTLETMWNQWRTVRPNASLFMKIFYVWAFGWRFVKDAVRAMLPRRLENYVRARL